ncbi:hypothetical protein GV794_14050 [Nocardia cyriacigeorgica]|uniref:Uncharacterized protein n=1 Tax=Nocardia cyriacigeorgica TaxID=135487 RepID=A0A6P1D5F0_9NOCA|nr:hypothetical protein [Nocardia cyriacigeorgica]NEW41811.1 hypothetical protein [Nocardia cyriacigeorgica]NEW45855.1 hypothetical protein [Nocardia cyriacigeorgica]NEW52522.1 hypothetical protein [Nocardia cyriacigeorgica]NEW56771.1 hypothetical protein [Nocardia cyriacigeorgica]
MMTLQATFTGDRVCFGDDHLSAADLPAADREVLATEIRDADPTAISPEIRTRAGVTLFVSATQREELDGFCAAHSIPIRRRFDVWAELLEPYLDTEFADDEHRATIARLELAGIPADEVAHIRERVGPVVHAYNVKVWEWVHLGLPDLLEAATTRFVPQHLRAGLGDLTEFRAWTMTVADRPVDRATGDDPTGQTR